MRLPGRCAVAANKTSRPEPPMKRPLLRLFCPLPGLLACLWLAAVLPALCASKAASPPVTLLPPENVQAVSSGVYRDAAAQTHPWQVTPAHALLWDGAAYVPVGGVWVPRSWKPDANAADWDADKAFLANLSAHGLRDVCVSAGAASLVHVSVPAVQRVLDALDAGGFHYGLRLAAFPRDPVVGYLIKPGVYRNPSPPASGPVRFRHIPGLADALYLLVSSHDGEVDEAGRASVVDGDTAEITLKNAGPDDVLLLYPQRLYAEGTPERRLPDLWQNFDEYRDTLLAFFQKIKLGPGLRFFLDPLSDRMALAGEAENIVPTTDGFRMDFQAWLSRRYERNVGDLNRGWGIQNQDLPDFTVASRCVPLWFGARGVPAVLDPVTGTRYAVINKPHIAGRAWDDINTFRRESARGYMNTLADALKRGVADIPIVYNWTGHSPLFAQTRTDGGYDGLCLAPSDTPVSVESGALLYAQAEEAAKTTWLLACATPPDGTESITWNALKELGTRGFFDLSLTPANTSGDPLNALNAFAAGIQLQASSLAEDRPRVLWYPAEAGLDIGARHLRDGAWWLPGFRAGDAVPLGPNLQGYVLPDPDGRLPIYVVWSPGGLVSSARFAFEKADTPIITDASGTVLKVAKKGVVWTLPVGPDPILIHHARSLPLPLDAADASEAEAKRLMALADDAGIATQRLKDQLYYALNSIPETPASVDARYGLLGHVIAALTEALRPYTWVEGESAAAYTFDSVTPDPSASGGAFLSLDTPFDPPSSPSVTGDPYHADYKFSVSTAGRYAVWMAGSVPGARDASPFTFSLDGDVPSDSRGALTEGERYGPGFVWSHLGDADLSRGPHTLTLTVTGRRLMDDHYALSVDALCVTRAPFHPNGPHPPPIDALPPPSPTPDKKGKH